MVPLVDPCPSSDELADGVWKSSISTSGVDNRAIAWGEDDRDGPAGTGEVIR
jgi:hypothetical protein